MRRLGKYCVGGGSIGSVYVFYRFRSQRVEDKSSSFSVCLYRAMREDLFRLFSEERAHGLSILTMKLMQHIFIHQSIREDLILDQNIFGMRFAKPLGLAAGFDKDASVTRFFGRFQGFLDLSFVEVGSVSNLPSKGNEFYGTPRMFRLGEHESLINFLGLPSQGAKQVQKNLAKKPVNLIVGCNLAKTNHPLINGPLALKDYLSCLQTLYESGDYFTINASCPNTGFETYENSVESFTQLIQEICLFRDSQEKKKPILVKLSASEKVEKLAEICVKFGVNGLILTNTSVKRNVEDRFIQSLPGGVSGKLLELESNEVIAKIFRRFGDKIVIIGVGGISDAESAFRKIAAGASLIQTYTALVFDGPGIFSEINSGLADLLRKKNYQNVSEAVGSEAHLY